MDLTDSFTSIRFFILSVWEDTDSGKGEIHFILENPQNGERLGFNDPESLAMYFENHYREKIDP
jgi:hypothetical protein